MNAARFFTTAALLAAVSVIGMSSQAHAQGKKESKGFLEIRKDKRGQYRFFYMSGGKALAMCTRGYAKTEDAMKDIDQVKTLIAKPDSGKGGLSYRKDKKERIRFYVKDAKGKTLAMSPRGYEKQEDAEKAVEQVKAIAATKPKIKG